MGASSQSNIDAASLPLHFDVIANMSATIHRLPVELIEIVACEEPTIMPKLRATSRDLNNKLLRKFTEHFFTDITISTEPGPMETLVRMCTEGKVFAQVVSSLRLFSKAKTQHVDLIELARDVDPLLSDRHAFRRLLLSILNCLPNCSGLGFEWEWPLVLESWAEGDGRDEFEGFMADALARDLSLVYTDLSYVVVTSTTTISHLAFDASQAVYISLDQWARLASTSRCEHTALTTVETLHLAVKDDTDAETPVLGTNLIVDEHQHECQFLHASTTGTLTTSGQAIQSFFSHLPKLAMLTPHIVDCKSNWLPSTFGPNIRVLTLKEEPWIDFTWDVGSDGGDALAAVLRNSPKLHCLRRERLWCPDVMTMTKFLRNIVQLGTLRGLELTAPVVGCDEVLCSDEHCPHAAEQVTYAEYEAWTTNDLSEEYVQWVQIAHTHRIRR